MFFVVPKRVERSFPVLTLFKKLLVIVISTTESEESFFLGVAHPVLVLSFPIFFSSFLFRLIRKGAQNEEYEGGEKCN